VRAFPFNNRLNRQRKRLRLIRFSPPPIFPFSLACARRGGSGTFFLYDILIRSCTSVPFDARGARRQWIGFGLNAPVLRNASAAAPEPPANCPLFPSSLDAFLQAFFYLDLGAALLLRQGTGPQFWRHRSLPTDSVGWTCVVSLIIGQQPDPTDGLHLALASEELGTVFKVFCTRAFLSPKKSHTTIVKMNRIASLDRCRMLLRCLGILAWGTLGIVKPGEMGLMRKCHFSNLLGRPGHLR